MTTITTSPCNMPWRKKEGVEVSSTLSLTSVHDGGGWLTPHPGHFTPRKEQAAIVQEAAWVPGSIRMGVEVMTVSYTLNKLDCTVNINMGKLWQEKDCIFHSEPRKGKINYGKNYLSSYTVCAYA